MNSVPLLSVVVLCKDTRRGHDCRVSELPSHLRESWSGLSPLVSSPFLPNLVGKLDFLSFRIAELPEANLICTPLCVTGVYRSFEFSYCLKFSFNMEIKMFFQKYVGRVLFSFIFRFACFILANLPYFSVYKLIDTSV